MDMQGLWYMQKILQKAFPFICCLIIYSLTINTLHTITPYVFSELSIEILFYILKSSLLLGKNFNIQYAL